MTILFYPQEDELITGTIDQKLEVLLEAAERYKARVLETGVQVAPEGSAEKKRTSPRDIRYSWNWEEIAKLLRQIREMPESSPPAKMAKSAKFKKLAEIYEVLRAAKMPKLEAVRLALMNECAQLTSGGSQVA
ncbi:MAG TPA: hypothetical protein VLJ15_07985 [Gammaproteobacteria bacterium]|nr:hypothetical protein [Gammaproteobacteria bacterium]